MIRLAAVALISACVATPLAAQDTQRRTTAEEIAALPATTGASGIRSRILLGDPAKPGPYALALDYPPGLEVKPHRHRDHRNLVVLRDSISFGYGTVADRATTKTISAGGYITEAAETPHFGFVGPEGMTAYLTGWGPSDNRPEPAPK